MLIRKIIYLSLSIRKDLRMSFIIRFFLIFVFSTVLVGCKKQQYDNDTLVTNIDSTTVKISTFYHTFSGYGEIEPLQSMLLVAKFNGIIHLNITKNLHYNKGERIFSLTGKEIELLRQDLSSELKVAQANIQYINEVMKRKKSLKDKQLISVEEWQQFQKYYAEAEQKLLEAKINFNYFQNMTEYRAPREGILMNVEFSQGGYVQKGQTLARFWSSSGIKLVGQFYGDPAIIQQDKSLEIVINDSLKATGDLIYLEKAINRKTGGRTFWIVLDTLKSNLDQGSFVKFLLRYAPYKAAAVPESALVMEHDKFYVVISENGKYQNQQVEVGRGNCGLREIINGPPPGTLILTLGAFEIFYSHLKHTMKVKD
ncbi:MAG: hypothetical protein ISS41_10940 [Candidatus Aminicenantes bacterium]|nr:hypothetical protein [Candidatus Aminicenantes bacterium]